MSTEEPVLARWYVLEREFALGVRDGEPGMPDDVDPRPHPGMQGTAHHDGVLLGLERDLERLPGANRDVELVAGAHGGGLHAMIDLVIVVKRDRLSFLHGDDAGDE